MNDKEIKIAGEGTTLWDDQVKGLQFRARKNGVRSFHFYYRMGTIQRRPKIGEYPLMTLAMARKKAAEMRLKVQAGIDPTIIKQERIAAKTFSDLAHDYVELYAKVNKKTWRKDEQMINRDLLPAFKNMPLLDIKRADIATVINVVRKRSPVMANRTFEVTRKMFNWAVEQGLIEVSPCYLLKKPAPESKRDRVLSCLLYTSPSPRD